MDRIATLHVVRERRGRQPLVMGRMLTDRLRLRGVPGLAFATVLGTGRNGDTAPSADLRRQAYFLVWDEAAAAHRFLASHRLARRWSLLDIEHQLELRLVSGHGTWFGHRVLDGMTPIEDDTNGVVVITRARIRFRWWRAFRRASRRTAASLEGSPGLRWTLGVGELPVGLLGTVSCWRSQHDLDEFLERDHRHAEAMSRADDWFAESLFARFAPTDLAARTCLPGTG